MWTPRSPCAAKDISTPLMSLSALPPYFTVAKSSNIAGAKIPVLRRMPLRCKLGKRAGEIIFAGYNLPSRTNRAPRFVAYAGLDYSLPLMALFTNPPYLTAGIGCDILRLKISVLRRMPLRGKFRERGSEIVLSRINRPIGAIRATATKRTILNGRLPRMTLLTSPPHLAGTAGCDVLRPQIPVLGRMPLGRDLRRHAGETIFAGDALSIATRTALSPGTIGNTCFPLMAFFTAPPNVFTAAVSHLLRR